MHPLAATVTQLLAARTGTVFFPEAASTVASSVDWMFDFVFWNCVFFFVLICVLMVVFVVRYRRTDNPDSQSSATHNDLLELTWTVIPSLITVFMFYEGMVTYLDMKAPPSDAYPISVIAKKWNWQFQYPNGWIENELHVPVGRPVLLTMRSDDVLHSLFIPAFRVKMDVVPGRYTKLWFQATKTGEYDLECTEYCGQKHSEMLAKVFVEEPAAFEKGLQDRSDVLKTLPPIEAGKYFWEKRGCMQCHSIDGAAKAGPSWKGTFGSQRKLTDGTSVLADENYIRESILQPQAKVVAGFQGNMPSFQGQFKDKEIDAIIEFIKTLK